MGLNVYPQFTRLDPLEQCKTVLKIAADNDGVVFSKFQVTITVCKMLR